MYVCLGGCVLLSACQVSEKICNTFRHVLLLRTWSLQQSKLLVQKDFISQVLTIPLVHPARVGKFICLVKACRLSILGIKIHSPYKDAPPLTTTLTPSNLSKPLTKVEISLWVTP